MIKKYFFRGKVALEHEGKVSFVARYKKKGTISLGFWDSVPTIFVTLAKSWRETK